MTWSGNGYGNWVDSLVTGFIAQSLLITGVSAHSFAGDRDLGALRHLLIRLSSRTQIVLVKLTLLHLLALCSVLLLVLGSWLLSSALWELGPVIEDGYELISEGEILDEIHLGLRLAFLQLQPPLHGDNVLNTRSLPLSTTHPCRGQVGNCDVVTHPVGFQRAQDVAVSERG